MLARTIIVLVSSPWYGCLVSLITIPMMIVFWLAAGLLGGSSLLMAGALVLASLVFQAVVYAQSARYAGSLTGLQSILVQPEFLVAVRRCLVVTIIIGILSGLVTIAFFVVVFQLGGADHWWWMDPKKLGPALETAMNSPARAQEIFSFQNLNLASLIFAMEAITMFFLTIIGLFAVPRAIGLGAGYERGYSVNLIMVRFFIALPFLAAMSGLISLGALSLFQMVAGTVIDDVGVTAGILYVLEIVLFTGMIFSFEAALLRTAREQGTDEAVMAREIERADTSDLRSLRESWNERR